MQIRSNPINCFRGSRGKKLLTAKEANVAKNIKTQRRRQRLLPPLARSSKYDRSNSLPETLSKISAIVPDVATVRTQVAAVASQIALVTTDVAALVAGSPIVSMAKVAPITAHIAPVGTAIDSVVPKVAAVAGPI